MCNCGTTHSKHCEDLAPTAAPDVTTCCECGESIDQLYVECFQCGSDLHSQCAMWREVEGEATPFCDACGTPLAYIDKYGGAMGPQMLELTRIANDAERVTRAAMFDMTRDVARLAKQNAMARGVMA